MPWEPLLTVTQEFPYLFFAADSHPRPTSISRSRRPEVAPGRCNHSRLSEETPPIRQAGRPNPAGLGLLYSAGSQAERAAANDCRADPATEKGEGQAGGRKGL